MPFEPTMDYALHLTNSYLVPFGIRLVTALLVFYFGRMAARLLLKVFNRAAANKLDDSLRKFSSSILYMLSMAVVVIAALDQLGVESTAAVAILGAAGLAVGLALQGSLGNFAAGFLLILFRPFKVGDFITAAGQSGTVDSVEVFTTTLITPDNRVIIVPNGQIASSAIINFSGRDTRRIDLVIGIGYGDDIKQAKSVIEAIFEADERILAEPAPTVAVGELGESSVDLVVRPWVNRSDFWAVRCDITQTIKESFDKAGISIPFPQRDLHIVRDDDAPAAPLKAESA
ncbi:MAG: mechanosensitive ion channel [Haliangiales bacterium]